MSDDQQARYGAATEPDQPAEPSTDQPALFEDPAATPHDIEPVAGPEGSWEPEEEPAWEPGPEPDLPEAWDEPAPDQQVEQPAEEGFAHEARVDDRPVDEAPVDDGPVADVPMASAALQETASGPVVAQDVAIDSFGEDDSYPDPDQDPAGEPVPAGTRNGGGLVAMLSFLVVALLLLAGWLGYAVADNRGAEPIASTRTSALAAGRDAARLVFSYDYRHLDKDFAAAAAVTTGKFKTDYQSTTKKLVGDVAPRYKAVLLAEVSEAGVITASPNRVQLLVFLDVQSTSTLAATPKVTPRRLKMTMQRSGDRWLVSAVDAF